ncbi:MAG: YifB family Mg chelatase-like AAA ATPase [Defluviitaleaceae bacterium]|nr:YifB family Mg chelatase-like AAA ATPase [Defluviitaleaceae bacterium]
MLAKIISGALIGIDGYLVEVEVDLASGMPAFDIVGLPDSAVKESRERVRTAVRNTGYNFPVKRITVNLAPADIRKSGPAFDLPIAVGILIGTKILPQEAQSGTFFTGELSLDGAVRPVSGVLPMVLAARDSGLKTCFVPAANAEEAALVEGITIYPLQSINQLADHYKGREITPAKVDIQAIFRENADTFNLDFADVKGQSGVKRALEVSAAGYHNLLMVGPPGAGKTMLATRMPTIMPGLDFDESIEITKIYSIAGLLDSKCQLITNRPFRSPHHTASYVSLTGGGRIPKPGEISLAHNGVLFLDELTEFEKKALEVLRQPLEDGKITVSRVGGVCTYPSAFLLLASMNPCPCGHYGTSKCRCSQHEVDRYLSRVSGPLLDRLDIQCEVTPVKYDALSSAPAEKSEDIKNRVLMARKRQQERFTQEKTKVNAHMTAPQIDKYCTLGKDEKLLLQQAFDRMNLSARAYHKILKIARTIADLAGEDNISAMHLTEAISYRGLDRKYW